MRKFAIKQEIVEKCLNDEKIMKDMGILFKTTPAWTKRKVKDQRYLTSINAINIIKSHLKLEEKDFIIEIK